MNDLYSSPEAARFFGLNRSYVSREAKKAFLRGEEWPVKRGQAYEAPLWAWEKILNRPDKVKRKPRKRTAPNNGKGKLKQEEEFISASKAALRLNVAKSWLTRLGKRAHTDKRYHYPVWSEKRRMWLAPFSEWKKIEDDPRLRKKRMRK